MSGCLKKGGVVGNLTVTEKVSRKARKVRGEEIAKVFFRFLFASFASFA